MRTTTADDGATLAYDVVGRGHPMVLVHGITESSASWEPLVDPLAASHEVVLVDLRGHGSSERRAPYDLGTMSADLRRVVEASGAGDGAVLVGHSLGGAVVSAYAAAFPCRAVVNVDQPLALAGFQAGLRQLEPMLRGSEAEFQAAVTAVFESMRGELQGEQADRIAHLRQADQEVVLGIWATVLESSAEDLDAVVAAVAAGITVPYLSLHGIDPGADYAIWLRGLVPTAEVEVWAGVGHYPHLVAPRRFLERVAAFEASLD
jgi:pimeloyl-ACP methyl ester carboxylesterase